MHINNDSIRLYDKLPGPERIGEGKHSKKLFVLSLEEGMCAQNRGIRSIEGKKTSVRCLLGRKVFMPVCLS